jgi:hypothetical protein
MSSVMMPNLPPESMPGCESRRARGIAVLGLVFSLGLALGACSKCDVPAWLPNPAAPHTCHAGPPAQ